MNFPNENFFIAFICVIIATTYAPPIVGGDWDCYEKGRKKMDGITIIKKGEYDKEGLIFSNGNQSFLIYQQSELEVIIDVMPKGTIGYLSSPSAGMAEMNYLLSGQIEICELDGIAVLSQGDFFCMKEFGKNVMFRVLQDTQLLFVNNRPYFEVHEERLTALEQVLDQLQAVDGDTREHCERVKALSMGIAYFMHFDQTQLDALFYASRFHDVGKSKIPLEILLKPVKLTNEEYEIMKLHSQYTYEMIFDQLGEKVATIAYDHHERLDGNGYPRHLKGDEISIAARIICVADAYDAMVTDRPYHVGKPKTEAIAELFRCSGTQFDESVIIALRESLAGGDS